jgi:hypothetical protein
MQSIYVSMDDTTAWAPMARMKLTVCVAVQSSVAFGAMLEAQAVQQPSNLKGIS